MKPSQSYKYRNLSLSNSKERVDDDALHLRQHHDVGRHGQHGEVLKDMGGNSINWGKPPSCA